MANPSDKQMLRDANGDLIPQYWDITAGDFKPLTGSDGANDVRLTGSNVEYSKFEVAIQRQILTSNESVIVDVPKGARSMLISLVIYGMTGDFEDGEGVGLTTRLGINQTISFPERDFYEIKTTEDVVTRSNFVHAITDFDIEQPSYFRNKDFQAIKTMLPTTIRVRIDVSGTFSGDEGVDCELYCKFD